MPKSSIFWLFHHCRVYQFTTVPREFHACRHHVFTPIEYPFYRVLTCSFCFSAIGDELAGQKPLGVFILGLSLFARLYAHNFVYRILSQVIYHSKNTYRLQSLDRLYRTISIWRKKRSSIRVDWHVPIISSVGRNFQRRRLSVDEFALSRLHTGSRSN